MPMVDLSSLEISTFTLLLLLLSRLIANMWCFALSVGAVHNDSTVSVVRFDIAGTLKQKVGVASPASAAPPPKWQLTSRESSKV